MKKITAPFALIYSMNDAITIEEVFDISILLIVIIVKLEIDENNFFFYL